MCQMTSSLNSKKLLSSTHSIESKSGKKLINVTNSEDYENNARTGTEGSTQIRAEFSSQPSSEKELRSLFVDCLCICSWIYFLKFMCNDSIKTSILICTSLFWVLSYLILHCPRLYAQFSLFFIFWHTCSSKTAMTHKRTNA